jgi:hypothetical protein
MATSVEKIPTDSRTAYRLSLPPSLPRTVKQYAYFHHFKDIDVGCFQQSAF